jgi:hypothetical protein
MTATSPQPSPTKADLAAIEDLTTLAAHLNQLGHTTHLTTTSPPHLTLDYPGINVPQQIHIAPPPGFPDDGDWFCWHDPSRPCSPSPFTRRATPLPLAAERANRIMHVFVIACQLTRTQQPPPTPPTPPAPPAPPARHGHLPACALPQAGGPAPRTPGAPVKEGTRAPGHQQPVARTPHQPTTCGPVQGPRHRPTTQSHNPPRGP